MDIGLHLATRMRQLVLVNHACMAHSNSLHGGLGDHLLGYYSVLLETPQVFAELTVAGVYTGVHRYTFSNSTDKKYLLFDITHSVQKVMTLCGSYVQYVWQSQVENEH